MFVCKGCYKKDNMQVYYPKSFGRCEICGKHEECYSVPYGDSKKGGEE